MNGRLQRLDNPLSLRAKPTLAPSESLEQQTANVSSVNLHRLRKGRLKRSTMFGLAGADSLLPVLLRCSAQRFKLSFTQLLQVFSVQLAACLVCT